MFGVNFMPCSYNAALEQGESRFHGIRVNVAVGILAGVIDGLVLVALNLVERPRVDAGFIRHNDFHLSAHMSIDNLSHRSRLGILGADKPKIAVALANPNDDLLDAFFAPSALLTANVSLINLHGAIQGLRSGFLHRGTDSMAEVPRCAVSGVEHPRHLERGHAFLGLAKQIRRKKPFMQGQMGIVKDGPREYAKLVAA